jgi:outer membrane protein OmpA-like peptidoglycan-associated protein
MKRLILALTIASAAGPLWAKKLPMLTLSTDCLFFSPNKDKMKDELVLKIEVENIKSVVSWEVQVLDTGGSVRKTFAGTGDIPSEITWSGQDEFGALCAEGTYEVFLRAWDKKNQHYVTTPLRCVLDLTPPTVSLSASEKRFLYKDGLPSGVTFYFSAVDLSGIGDWRLTVLDAARKEYYAYASSGSLPSSWAYPEEHIPSGPGTVVLTVTDLAGNRGSSPPLEMGSTAENSSVPAPANPARAVNPDQPAVDAYSGPYLQLTTIMSVADLFGNGADNQSLLQPQAAILLDPLAEAILSAPGTRVTILGHVDQQKSPESARALSSYFAWRVFSYLVKNKGVNKNSISVKGLGATLPIGDNHSSQGRARNRRVEIQMFLPAERRP